jgi:galactokinase
MRTDSDPATAIVATAPGRANLIGEHTDYNDGFVLPVALELRTEIRGRRATLVRLASDGHPGTVTVDPATGEGPTEGWGRYVTAVVRVLSDAGLSMGGIDGLITSDVPVGTGLSSSAALEVAVALAVLDEPLDALELARLCQRAENEHVGVRSGIMDQLTSAGASSDAALFIDCRSLETEPAPMPDDLRVVVVDSGQRRELSAGDYNRRRAECEEAARLLGVGSLRDVQPLDLGVVDLPEPLDRRVRHVVTENERVLAAREALRREDRPTLGVLFAASHRSLAADFAVSTPRLDALVEAAIGVDGVVAARMTGAGFGGCIVALVDAERASVAAEGIVDRYRRATGHAARSWVSRAGAGALQLRSTQG